MLRAYDGGLHQPLEDAHPVVTAGLLGLSEGKPPGCMYAIRRGGTGRRGRFCFFLAGAMSARLTCSAATTHCSAAACLHHAGTYKSCVLLVWIKYTDGAGTGIPLTGSSFTKTPKSFCIWPAASPRSSFQHPCTSKYHQRKHLLRVTTSCNSHPREHKGRSSAA